MKRTQVILDDELLENARRILGEKTYSATINVAPGKVVRQEKFWAAYRKFEELAHGEGFFDPEYLAEKTRKSVWPDLPKSQRDEMGSDPIRVTPS